MKIRKISASYIFAGPSGFLKNGILSLSEDGRVLNLTDTGGNLSEEAGLEHYNGILCPGFVNAHCHIELSHMKGKIPRNTELTGFIEAIIPGRRASNEVIHDAIANADLEMRKEGVVAVGDICNTSDSFETKAHSPIYYHSFVEIFGTSPGAAHSIYRNGQNLVHQARHKFSLKASLTPHTSYSLGNELFTLFYEEKVNAGDMISVHNQESQYENDLVRNGNGALYDTFVKMGFDMSTKTPQNKDSLHWLLEQLSPDTRKLLVHNLYTREKDIVESGAENQDIYWVLCPKSNYYIGGLYPGKFLMERFSQRICIGTDSLASNDKLSVLEEIFAIQNVYPEIPLHELLSWATINGARSLGIDKWCGSFEEGKKPGIILIENADIPNLRLKKESRVKLLVTSSG
jgi:cytosine/adenosine deaminase-related metal-dependent hydrolase